MGIGIKVFLFWDMYLVVYLENNLLIQINPTEPAVKPTIRKKENSNKSLGKEFMKRLIWVI